MNRVRVLLLLLSVTLLLAACGGARRDDSGDIVEEGDVSAFELKLGDCFNDPSGDSETVSDVAAVPCAELHDNEVFHLVDYPGGSDAEFPGQDALDEFSQTECEAAFEGYVGIPYTDSNLYLAPLQPTESSWAQGDREVVCVLFGEDVQLEGSKKGSNE